MLWLILQGLKGFVNAFIKQYKKATSIIFDVALNSKYMLQLASVLLFYQLVCTVFLTEGWFFDLAGRVTRYFCEDDLLRTLVARQLLQ